MPYTRRQVRLLLSDASPLDEKQKAKMRRELHENPEMGHMRKGGSTLKRKSFKLSRDTARRLKERARMI